MLVRVILLLSIVALGLTLWRVAEVERQRYALFTGHCDEFDIECLETADPRTSRLWNLYFGLVD